VDLLNDLSKPVAWDRIVEFAKYYSLADFQVEDLMRWTVGEFSYSVSSSL